MSDWLSRNWGDIAGLIGMGLSFWAWRIAQSAKNAVAEFRRKQSLMVISATLAEAVVSARKLSQSRARAFPRSACDELRERLVEIVQCESLVIDERISLRSKIAWFHSPLANRPVAQAEIRRLLDLLIGIRKRIQSQIEEHLA